MTEQIPEETYSSDVHVVELDNRKFILVGTAHISKESARLVREVIEKEQPDTVCVELDQQRYKSLAEQRKWENLDLKSVIRQKQLATLLIIWVALVGACVGFVRRGHLGVDVLSNRLPTITSRRPRATCSQTVPGCVAITPTWQWRCAVA